MPVAFTALGTVFATRSGVMHMGQEGFMLITGFVGVACSYFTGLVTLSILMSVLMGILLGLIYAYFAVSQRGNNINIGVGFNFLGSGLTAVLICVLWQKEGNSPSINGVSNFMTMMEAKDSFLKTVFGTQNVFFIILLVLVIVMWVLFYHTPLGLRIRIAGELPIAVECTGGSVKKLRYFCMACSGALMGLAGASMTLGTTKMFGRDMMSGRGFVALAMCLLGRHNPVLAFACCLLYGFLDALQIRMQGTGVPSQFMQMIPYVFTIIVIACAGKFKAPSALGKPFPEE